MWGPYARTYVQEFNTEARANSEDDQDFKKGSTMRNSLEIYGQAWSFENVTRTYKVLLGKPHFRQLFLKPFPMTLHYVM